jgi:hypothetical protein
MPDRPFPAVDNLIRRAQRVAAGRPDPARILAQTISMACPGGADPYGVLGVLIEGTVQTLVEHIPKERRAETAAMLKQLLEERLKASGIPDGDAPPPDRPKSF